MLPLINLAFVFDLAEIDFVRQQIDDGLLVKFSATTRLISFFRYVLWPLYSLIVKMANNRARGSKLNTLFEKALTNAVAYQAIFPDVDPDCVLDMNGDGVFNNLGIAGFVAALTGP